MKAFSTIQRVALTTVLAMGIVALPMIAPASALAQEPLVAAESQGQGSPLFVIIYRAGPNWTHDVPVQQQGLLEHFRYMQDIERQGRIMIAGPMGADGGLVVLRAADQGEAERVIREDPAVIAGKFLGSAAPFFPRLGRLSN